MNEFEERIANLEEQIQNLEDRMYYIEEFISFIITQKPELTEDFKSDEE